MVTLSDIRPLLHIARIFGCGLYVVGEDDIVTMKYSAFYTAFFTLLYGTVCVTNFYALTKEDALGPRLLALTVARTGLSYTCVFVDIALTSWYEWKVRAALSQLRVFDRATKYKEHAKTYTVRYISWILSFVIMAFWSTAGYLTFRCEPKDPLFNGLTYAFINTTLSMQLLRFISLSFLLRERFRRLCEILLLPEDGKIMVVDRSARQLRLQEVWWLHSCLANATELINSVYGVQLLLWIAGGSFNTLTRIYTINEHTSLSTFLIARETMMVSACATNLLLITTVCHSIAGQANHVGKIAFSPSSAIVAKRNFAQDYGVDAATYFQLHKVHFFAAFGLILIDLPLLLSITSGITTYLVILHTANS
ncbi:PREDICTED: uncharacterized protein LOC106750294 [Dinoponera quadriceps]|uniref:Gustatory receptor n=1 Tax=Dinoponera quadriceps TaxID=609295 RepID=A0A6P3Y524_DINQU|nr:PREDICTED: uncharacterized protein LOC106750294 [Dinoponera quadriceps]